jgi:hypothetical protein
MFSNNRKLHAQKTSMANLSRQVKKLGKIIKKSIVNTTF